VSGDNYRQRRDCKLKHICVEIGVFTRTVYLTLIARRSRHYAGARFLTRGANEQVGPPMLLSRCVKPALGWTDMIRATLRTKSRRSRCALDHGLSGGDWGWVEAELIQTVSRNHWQRLLAYHRALNRNSAVMEDTPPSSNTEAVFLSCGTRNRIR
jgi:hypothetical protein